MKRLTLLALLCMLLPLSSLVADDEREPDESSASSSSSRRSTRTYSSSSSRSRQSSYTTAAPKTYGLSDQARDFLRNPEGLTLVLGFGMYSWADLNADTLSYSGTDDIRKLFAQHADNMLGFRFGFELGKSFVNLRVAPYIGADALYIEAETGLHLLDPRAMKSEVLFAQSTFYFWGSMLSFSRPVITAAQASQFSADDIEHYNGGNGFTATGIAVAFQIGLRIGPFSIMGGFLASASVVLPDHPLAALGWLGPNIQFDVLPGSMSIFFEMRPERGIRQLTAASWEIGTRFYW